MAEKSPRWRMALADNTNPLYKAAWIVFTERVSPERAFAHVKDDKDTVVPFLNEILEDDSLFDNDSPGKGTAPANAARLLGEYQVREALPKLLELLADSTNFRLRNACNAAIAKLGPDVIDEVIEWANVDGTRRPKAAELLEDVGVGSEKAFQTILTWISPEITGLEYYARYLTRINPEAGIEELQKLSKDSRFNGDVRRRFKDRIKEAQEAIKERDAQAAS
jgi:HEAT repeat protein